MPDSMKRTPLPWMTVRDNHVSVNGTSMRLVFSERGADVAYIVPVDGNEGNTNAAIIVRAVNLHAELLEACEALCAVSMPEITGPIHPTGSWQDRLRQAVVKAREAVSKAKAGAA